MTTLREYMEMHPSYMLSLSDIADSSLREMVQAYSRDRCLSTPMPEERVLCRVLGKYTMWVDAYDQGLSPHLITEGYWEMWITAALVRFARSGTTVVDIGANVGYYTLLLADAVGPQGTVIAFEPNPRIAEMLKLSVSINGFASRVNIRPEAVAHAAGGSMRFGMPKNEPKNARVIREEADREMLARMYGNTVSYIDVPITSLDALDLRNVGIVKIDAEGAEVAVWEGMQATIDRNPDICILMEINCNRSYDAVALYHAIDRKFPVRFVDFDGRVKDLSPDMLAVPRTDDWMLFLCRT